MSVKKKICEKCKREISYSNFDKHFNSCKKDKKYWFINENNNYECEICHYISSSSGIGNHIKYHFGYKNPNLGHESWSKGLTKETDERIKKNSETFKKHLNEGKFEPSFKGKKHSKETRAKWKSNPNMGGLREGSGRGIKGWYKGFYCRSTWELAWLAYQLEHNIIVEHCYETFEYRFEEKIHRYYPDFIVEGAFIEIKGYRNKNVEAKIKQFPLDKKLILVEGSKEIKPYLEYCEKKYGKEFWKVLFENFNNKQCEKSKRYLRDKAVRDKKETLRLYRVNYLSKVNMNIKGWQKQVALEWNMTECAVRRIARKLNLLT